MGKLGGWVFRSLFFGRLLQNKSTKNEPINWNIQEEQKNAHPPGKSRHDQMFCVRFQLLSLVSFLNPFHSVFDGINEALLVEQL
jgi:hypothetical protein